MYEVGTVYAKLPSFKKVPDDHIAEYRTSNIELLTFEEAKSFLVDYYKKMAVAAENMHEEWFGTIFPDQNEDIIGGSFDDDSENEGASTKVQSNSSVQAEQGSTK